MTEIHRSALVPYSAAEMYALVSDIGTYPDFLPWCSGAQVLERSETEVVARIDIDYKGLRKSFTTRNVLQRDRAMQLLLLDGPFSRLDGRWSFESLGDSGSKIRFDLEFQFSNRLVGLAVGPVFGHLANTMVDSFRERARAIYGQR